MQDENTRKKWTLGLKVIYPVSELTSDLISRFSASILENVKLTTDTHFGPEV